MKGIFKKTSVVMILFLLPLLLLSCWTNDEVSGEDGTYTITYNANGADSGTVPIDITEYEIDGTITILGNTGDLAKTGYTFAGWCLNANGSDTTFTENQTFTIESTNITLYAKWAEVDLTYTVTYNGNTNTGGSVPIDNTNYNQDETVTVIGNTGSLVTTQSQDGITLVFQNWNTIADGSGTSYDGSDTFIINSEDVTLFAQWSVIKGIGPAGGYIVYDDEEDGVDDIAGKRYLEAAPKSTEWTGNMWSDPHNTEIGTGTGIGTGEANTADIVTALSGETDRAAQICNSLDYGSYTDWFLPSKDELDLMYKNLKINGIGEFVNNAYLSSSEDGASFVWIQGFEVSDPIQYQDFKNNTNAYTRAIRAF